MPKQHINPDGVSKPTNYTHVVASEGKRIVFISGQVAIDKDGNIVGEGNLEMQAEQVFENLKTCLASVNATFDDVVKLVTYIVNYKPDDRTTISALRQRYLPQTNPPASTLVGVQALAAPAIMIEIEAVAVLD